jgi:hypothetical protein
MPRIKKKTKKAAKPLRNVHIHVSLLPAKTTLVYDTYWRFAALRQDVFFSRLSGDKFPWTLDPVLNTYKFTNVYRASDRVSQYLIKNVIYNDSYPATFKEVFFRIMLFKLFNKIETWELLRSKIGEITLEDYTFKRYEKVLTSAMAENRRIYSAAYIMPSAKSSFGYKRKHSNHLRLVESMLKQEAHQRLAESKTMQQAFEILKAFPSLGDFLSYQFLIDLNYSTIINFSESDFVVPGPGAKGGISKCFADTGGLSEVEIIKLMTDRQDLEFERLNLSFKTLWGRPLQLIDCQNIFCEVDKYARVTHPSIKGNSDRTRIKQKFQMNDARISYWFPPKWGLNEKILVTQQSKILRIKSTDKTIS